MVFKRIRELREDNDYTQLEIAAYLNLNRNVYWRYETGEREIPVWAVIKLAKLYNVSFSFLIGVDDESEGNISKQARVKNTINMRKE